MKRAIDLTVAVLALPVALPAIAVCAAISALSLRAWPFFSQIRLGRHEQPFRIWKIRTLPRRHATYALKDAPDRRSGPTRATTLLRRTKLDELPQLLNVVRGELSLVGPRPKMPHEHEPVDPAYSARRTTVPQGCTGLWQISTASHLLPSDHPEFDYVYLANTGTRTDAWILWRTALLALRLGERVGLGDLPRWFRPATLELDGPATLRPVAAVTSVPTVAQATLEALD